MNYEIIKQLDEAGFLLKMCSKHTPPAIVEIGEKPYIPPTLSELIEACGNRFGLLQKFSDGWLAENNWRQLESGTIFQKAGSTPEEAVAKLWLALNKK